MPLFAEEEENRQNKKEEERNRKQYVRDWIARREEKGIYRQLVKELEVQDRAAYQDFLRLTSSSPTCAMFVYVLHTRARAHLAGKSQSQAFFKVCCVASCRGGGNTSKK